MHGALRHAMLPSDRIRAPQVLFQERSVSNLTCDELLFVLAMVSHREREMLRMRYGLDGFPPCSWAEIAEAFRMPLERACGVERKAFRRARAALG